MAKMERTSIMIPVELKMKANKLAAKRGISLGELIRDSLEIACSERPVGKNIFFDDQEVYKGKVPKDSSKNLDNYLYEGDEE